MGCKDEICLDAEVIEGLALALTLSIWDSMGGKGPCYSLRDGSIVLSKEVNWD